MVMLRRCLFLRILFFWSVTWTEGLVTHPPAVASSTRRHQPTSYYTEAEIDYSAANEFIAAHYGRVSYFPQDLVTEPILNARDGLMVTSRRHEEKGETQQQRIIDPSLTNNGFQLVPNSLPSKGGNIDWNNVESIRENYLPRVRDAIQKSYGSDTVEIYFWCPTLRSKDATPTPRNTDSNSDNSATPQAGYVATAHIDTDVNAYNSLQDVVDMVANNRFPGTDISASTVGRELQQTTTSQGRRRFAIVNAWRTIGSEPVRQAPLAFRPTHYQEPDRAFPFGTPDWSLSPWYTFPEMTPDELLLFVQYDRDARYPSDLWHCALTGVGSGDSVRESFDVRCFVVFPEQQVPAERDRLAQRLPSRLNKSQSCTFCSEQKDRRDRNKKSGTID